LHTHSKVISLHRIVLTIKSLENLNSCNNTSGTEPNLTEYQCLIKLSRTSSNSSVLDATCNYRMDILPLPFRYTLSNYMRNYCITRTWHELYLHLRQPTPICHEIHQGTTPKDYRWSQDQPLSILCQAVLNDRITITTFDTAMDQLLHFPSI